MKGTIVQRMMMKLWTALLMALIMMLAMLPLASPVPALAATPAEDALRTTLDGYYLGSQQGMLDDWEELATVCAAGENFTDYVLPATNTGTNSTTVINALIKGDMPSAQSAANNMVVSGASLTLVSAGYAYGDALNMIAIEAYNRSVVSGSTISYDKEAAVDTLLASKESDGGFGYGFGGDPDTTGIALVALSLYKDDSTSYAVDATDAINDALAYLDNTQQENGGFLGWAGNNANSSALVIWGLAALGENPDAALCSSSGNSPLDALLSFAANTGGFGVTDNSAADIYATKDATLALADVINSSSFLKTFSASPVQYKSVTVQVIEQNGDYSEKQLTVASDEQIEDAIARALGVDASGITLADYKCFIDGSLDNNPDVSDLLDGGTLLAVYKDYSQVAYFKTAAGDTMGVNEATVPFGGSQELTLVQADLANLGASPTALPSIPVDVNSDTYSDLNTDASGIITVSPIAASTTVDAIKSDFMGTHIPTDVAVLPAHIYMQQGPTQTATVSVRVEGITGNIINYHSYTAGNDGSSKLTAYDAVTQALDYAGVSYTATASGYLYEIDGTSAGSGTGPTNYDGWCYTYNDSSTWVGMKSQLIAGGDSIVVYYSNDDSTTLYPQVESQLEGDGSVTITVKDQQSANPVSGVTVTWGQGTAYAYTGFTGAGGTVAIPAAKAPLGSHSLQISKTDAYGLPSVVRLAPDYKITVTATGAEGPSPANPLADHVYASVVGPNGTLLASTAYPWYNGITPLALLGLTGLDYVNSGSYVSSIAGIKEFDYGPNSGWLFKVNDNASITEGSNSYQLNKDDQLVWFYTRDYTQEPGSAQWSNSLQQPGTTTAVATTIQINGVPTGVIPPADLKTLLEGIASGDNAVSISAPVTDNAGGVLFSIPEQLLAALCAQTGSSLTIESPTGNITFDAQALQSMLTSSGSGDISFNLAPIDASTLSASNQQLVGSHPVYSLSLTANGTNIASFGNGTAMVQLPYTPGSAENLENLAVFFISNGGVAVLMEGSAYDSDQQAMVFSTGHLSCFAIAYNENAPVNQIVSESTLQFTDVADDHWARGIIYYLAGRGIIEGTTATTFSPENIITRSEYASILARMSGDILPAGAGPFSDVPADSWFASNVAWAAEKGIVQGTDAGTFEPYQNISREDMAVMTMRYVEYQAFTLAATKPAVVFNDQEEIAPYAAEAVAAMQQAGIISGRLDGSFAPQAFASRAEAAQMLGTVLQLMKE